MTAQIPRARLLPAFLLIAALAAPMLVAPAGAQPALNFKRLVSNWPTIELYFAPTCNGQFQPFNDTGKVIVTEDGLRVWPVSQRCPDTNARCPMSASLVLCADSTMAGARNAGLKGAARAFVSLMDGANDQAAVLYMNDAMLIAQAMTADTAALRLAVDGLPASGGSCTQSSAYQGLFHTRDNGTNPCRAVVLVTDGADCVTPGLDSVAQIANKNHIRVFCVALGPNPMPGLQSWAMLTGGDYFWLPDTTGLTQTLRNIARRILRGFDECTVSYTAPCADGGVRSVDLTVLDICGMPVSGTKTYRAASDPLSWLPVQTHLPSDTVRSGFDTAFPMILDTPIPTPTRFGPFTCRIRYDSNAVRYSGVNVPSGSPLEGMYIAAQDSGHLVLISSPNIKFVSGSGTLFTVRFKGIDVPDTTRAPLTYEWGSGAASGHGGCLELIANAGEAIVLPPEPDLACNVTAPQALVVNMATRDYDPNPFDVTVTVGNQGIARVRDPVVRLEVDTTRFAFVSPVSHEAFTAPGNIAPGATGEALFTLRALKQAVEDTLALDASVLVRGTVEAQCATSIVVPAFGPRLQCSPAASRIDLDTATGAYLPFTLTAIVRNDGPDTARRTQARIVLPGGVVLSGVDAPDRFVKPLPATVLPPGASDSVRWELSALPAAPPPVYDVTIETWSDNAALAICSIVLTPPKNVPQLRCTVSTPVLDIDSASGDVHPMPFSVVVEVENAGIETADSVDATIILPSGAQLVPGESGSKRLAPPMLAPGTKGSVSWLVSAPPVTRDSALEIGATARALTGLPCASTAGITLPKVLPLLSASCALPPVLRPGAVPGTLEPNPFQAVLDCRNGGIGPADSVTATIVLPPNLRFEAPAEQATKLAAAALPGAGGSSIVRWELRYTGPADSNAALTVSFLVRGKHPVDGSALSEIRTSCLLYVAADTATQFACAIEMPDRLVRSGNDLVPTPVTIASVLRNFSAGSRTITSIELVVPPGEIDSVDAATPLLRTPGQELTPLDSMRTEWRVALRPAPVERTVPVFVRALTREGDQLGCDRFLTIDSIAAMLVCRASSGASRIVYDTATASYTPGAWTVSAELENTGGVTLPRALALLGIVDPSGADLVEFDPASPDTANPKIRDPLRRGERATFEWGLRMKNPNLAPDTAEVCFELGIASDITPPTPNACRVCVRIDPKLVTPVDRLSIPSVVTLGQNRPNPFSGATVIPLTVARGEVVRLSVHDLYGREVATLLDRHLGPGEYNFRFDASRLPTGSYISVMRTRSGVAARLMQFVP